jgi:mycofactocin precursor peptide peptidase
VTDGASAGLHLGDLTTVEAAGLGGVTLLVPLGATEQHGPHLPLGTDTAIALAVAGRAAAVCGAVVAPAVHYGSSGEHAAFAGTTSIGQDAVELVVVELVRSLWATAGRVVLVCGHGGNREPVQRAVSRLSDEGRGLGHAVAAWFPRVPGGDAHAGRTETSLMLAIDPALVRLDRAEAGATDDVAALMSRLRREGVAAVSPNGVLGDPSQASAEEGHRLLDQLVDSLVALVGEIHP